MNPVINLETLLPKKEEKYFQTSIPYKNLESQVSSNLTVSKKGIKVNEDNLNQLYRYFRKRYTRNQTLAVLSSIIAESGADPLKTELVLENKKLVPKGPGFGLLQYTNTSRKNKMLEHKSNDFPDSELMRQAEFIYGEMQDSKKFLSPLDSTQWLKKNGAYRKQFFNPNSSLKELNEAFVRPSEEDYEVKKRTEISEYLNDILPEHYKLGGKFTPKKSKLVKNAEEQNSKRDMRKKFIKSDRPTYTNNRVKKNQSGGVLSIDPSIFVSWNNISTSNIKLPEVDYTPKSNLDRFLERTENSASINLLGNPKEQEEKQDQKEIPVSKEEPIVKKTPLANPSKGNDAFNKIYDELISEMPDAAEYRDFLTTVAKYESGFDSKAKNKYAPAWGYFQFMQDDNKYNNIKSYAGVDTQTFLNNPKLQIRAAINLAKAMEKGFTKEDIEAAKSKGISRWGMLGGAWLGGNGGLRKYLLQNINSSDKHWNPEGKGIDMENQIRRYNF